MTLMVSVLLVVFIAFILAIVQIILSEGYSTFDNQLGSIESGFEKLWHSSLSSNPFFLMAMLFVLFDLELILLLPGVILSMESMTFFGCFVLLMILVTVTLFLEWGWFGLKWIV